MKRKFEIAALLFLPVLIWALALTDLQAQYIGSNIPVTVGLVHDSAAAKVDTARFKADSVAARAYSRTTAGDSAKAHGADSSAALRKAAQDSAARVNGDSLVEVRQLTGTAARDTFSAKIRDVAGLIRGDTSKSDILLQADSAVSPSGKFYFKNKIQVSDSIIAAIIKIVGEYSLPPRDTTAGLILSSGGAGLPLVWIPDATTSWGGADTAVVRNIAAPMIKDSLDQYGRINLLQLTLGQPSLRNMYLHGVKRIITLANKASWADSFAAGTKGTASWNTSIFKFDTVGLNMSWPSGYTSAGVHVVLGSTFDAGHFENADTSVAADYVRFWIYFTQAGLDSLSKSSNPVLTIYFSSDTWPTVTNDYYKSFNKANFAVGPNLVSIAKSAFTKETSGNWGAIKYVAFLTGNTPGPGLVAPGGIVVDAFQLVKKDSTATRANPFWVAGTKYWTETATSGLTIDRPDTVVVKALVPGDYLESISTLAGLDTISGRLIVSQLDSSYFGVRASGDIILKGKGGTKFFLMCAGGVSDSINYTYALKDTVTWKLVQNNGVATAIIHRSSNADSTMTGTYAGANTALRVQLYGVDRMLDGMPGFLLPVFKVLINDIYFYVTADSTKGS